METVNESYSVLVPGDVVREYDTDFKVTEVTSHDRRGVTVWTVYTVAITKPSEVLWGLVNRVGDEYLMQGSSIWASGRRVVPLGPERPPVDLTEFSELLGGMFL